MKVARPRVSDADRVATERSGAGPEPPALAVAAVARRLGVAPATLRTWDRRYGLGPSAHTAGSHRRYTIEDVARLLVMRRLTIDGVAPVDAARSARAMDRVRGRAPGAARRAGARRDEIARPGLLVEAALHDDDRGCRRLLGAAAVDVATWWTELLEPARSSLAARTELARPGEDPEWVLDTAALAVLAARRVPDGVRPGVGHRLALLLAPPRERRPLVLHVLAAALADEGMEARVVTGPVDPRRVLELVAMSRPVAVVLLSEHADPDLTVLAELTAAEPDLPLFVGLGEGRAESALRLAPAVRLASNFAGLLREILAIGE
ncbi:MerR family transcriptional regulator [Pengzhenrongella sp.]|jgi:transposase-like protein|uniref:MerR family transcriptional regulator n=1 Tax=Pengzhenrongella sp. TaxID=2888820 RepID=UPI002F92CB11